jgi:hypothetical protein|tara:strand:- start:331 stop:618 length:288 start_codon:yes stop_codon:yes gene_type:complete
MAKFIEVYSSGSGLDGGNVLIGVENIVGVDAASGTTTVIKMNGGVLDEVTLTHTSVGTTPSVRDAINYALTANPGGVKAKVQLPSGITVSNIVWS